MPNQPDDLRGEEDWRKNKLAFPIAGSEPHLTWAAAVRRMDSRLIHQLERRGVAMKEGCGGRAGTFFFVCGCSIFFLFFFFESALFLILFSSTILNLSPIKEDCTLKFFWLRRVEICCSKFFFFIDFFSHGCFSDLSHKLTVTCTNYIDR